MPVILNVSILVVRLVIHFGYQISTCFLIKFCKLFPPLHDETVGRDSSVCIATRYGLGRPTV